MPLLWWLWCLVAFTSAAALAAHAPVAVATVGGLLVCCAVAAAAADCGTRECVRDPRMAYGGSAPL